MTYIFVLAFIAVIFFLALDL